MAFWEERQEKVAVKVWAVQQDAKSEVVRCQLWLLKTRTSMRGWEEVHTTDFICTLHPDSFEV